MSRYSMAPTTPFGSRSTTPKSKGKNKQQKNFSFPILDKRDLFVCLEELCSNGFNEQEIIQCDKHVGAVRRLFEDILESLTGVRKEEINQPVFAAHEKLAYSQLHEDSIPELAFWKEISKLMEVCGISDFTREDLSRPDFGRLKRQLSALINFAKFREERLDEYNNVTTSRDVQLARLSTIDDENAALQEQLDQLREKNKAQRQEVKELNEETNAMATKVSQANDEQGALRNETSNLKQQNSELKEKLRNLEHDYSALIGDQKKFQGQVVQSPERVRCEMLESQRALESERRDGEASEQAALVALGAAKAVTEAISKVTEAANSADELLEMSNKCIEYGKTIKKRELVISNNEKQKDEVVQRISDVEHRCVRLNEKSKHLEASCESKAEQAARLNEDLMNKLMEEKRKKATEAAHFGEEDKMCEAIEAKLEEDAQEHRQKLHDFHLAWSRLEATVRAKQQAMVQEMAGQASYLPQTQGQFSGYDAYAVTPQPTGMHSMYGVPIASPFQTA